MNSIINKLFYLVLLAVLLNFSNNVKAQQLTKGQEWKSIVTLRSSRAEVEERFGKPDESSDNETAKLYKLKDYNLLIIYSRGCNADKKSDYNVPANTVTHFTVYLKFEKKLPLRAINIDRTKFEKTVLPNETYLDNSDEGVTYRISKDEALIYEISYRPKKEDYKLNCSKYQKN